MVEERYEVRTRFPVGAEQPAAPRTSGDARDTRTRGDRAIDRRARRDGVATPLPRGRILSLFTYCTQALHLSEDAAYNRTRAAGAARKWPVILRLIADGSVTLTAVRLLAGLLTEENHQQLLESVRRKTKREIEQLVAALHPQPAVPSTIRKLPSPKPEAAPAPAAEAGLLRPALPSPPAALVTARPSLSPTTRPAVVAPLAPERYKVQVTVSRETHDKLRRIQDLLRHQVPDGDPAAIFDRALTLLLQDLERRKLAQTTRPRPQRGDMSGSRHVPAAVKREVWKRDEGRCAFVGAAGRCTERGFLEVHHVVPFADGGPTTAENLQLRCRAHNAYEAEQHFGPLFVREVRSSYSSFRNELGHGLTRYTARNRSHGRYAGRVRIVNRTERWIQYSFDSCCFS